MLTYQQFTTVKVVLKKLVERFHVPDQVARAESGQRATQCLTLCCAPQEKLPQYANLSPEMFKKTVVLPIRHQVLSISITMAQVRLARSERARQLNGLPLLHCSTSQSI